MIIFLMHKNIVNVCLNNDSVTAKNFVINGISEFFDGIFESIKPKIMRQNYLCFC
jgi:ATP-dependent Clp protease adapter protein ClpS